MMVYTFEAFWNIFTSANGIFIGLDCRLSTVGHHEMVTVRWNLCNKFPSNLKLNKTVTLLNVLGKNQTFIAKDSTLL